MESVAIAIWLASLETQNTNNDDGLFIRELVEVIMRYFDCWFKVTTSVYQRCR